MRTSLQGGSLEKPLGHAGLLYGRIRVFMQGGPSVRREKERRGVVEQKRFSPERGEYE